MTNSNPLTNIDPAEANVLGSNLADVVSKLTPAGRREAYKVATIINTIAVPVYSLGGSAALFIGGTIGADIAVGTVVLGVAVSVLSAFVARLAKANVKL